MSDRKYLWKSPDFDKYRPSRKPMGRILPSRITTPAGYATQQQKLSEVDPADLGIYESIRVKDDTFAQMVTKHKGKVILMFASPGCSACRQLRFGPWQELYKKYKNHIRFYEFLCTGNSKTDKSYKVTGHPTVVFFDNGIKKGDYLGSSMLQMYESYIKHIWPELASI